MPPSTFGEGVIMCFPGKICSFSSFTLKLSDCFNEIAEFSILHLVHAEESISSEMLVLITVLLALGTILLIITF